MTLPLRISDEVKAKVEAERKVILDLLHREENLKPSAQLALLDLRRSELSIAVVTKLKASTVVVGVADRETLLHLRLATVEKNGRYRLTPRGHMRANTVAQQLAREFGVKVPTFGMKRRSAFSSGVFSQAGNW